MALTKPKHKTLRESVGNQEDESLWRVFWKGFFLPIKLIGRGIAWLSHRPPLKQIGHSLRWFFTRTPMRILAVALGLRYIYRSIRELRSVTWPSFRESIRLTGAVILFAVIFGVFVAVVDYGLDKLFKQYIIR